MANRGVRVHQNRGGVVFLTSLLSVEEFEQLFWVGFGSGSFFGLEGNELNHQH